MMNSKWQRDNRKFLAEKSRTQSFLVRFVPIIPYANINNQRYIQISG